jgi:hypothetical protein
MATSTEFVIRMEDRPGTLGKLARRLADRGVNVLALQSTPFEGQSQVRLVVDNASTAKTVLDNDGVSYKEEKVAQVTLPHRPGELARAATRLGEANININHVYCGIDPRSNQPLLIFGVADVERASTILDQVATTAKAA